jgi:hypothetical protein
MVESFFIWVATAAAVLMRVGDVRSSAVPLVGALFGAGWLLGAAQPDGAWRRALVLGLSVPLAHAAAAATHTLLPFATPSFMVACLALVPAGLGSWAGVAARRAWTVAAASAAARG